jgi:hypothetical protein
VAKVAKETGVATQMGNFGASSEGHRQTAEWIWDGAIGQVREVHAWGRGRLCPRKGRPDGHPGGARGLNWDLWLGPSEKRPYHPAYAPFNWRGWWAFGGGGLPTWPPPPRPGLQRAQAGRSADRRSHGSRTGREVCSTGVLVTYRFAARGTWAR